MIDSVLNEYVHVDFYDQPGTITAIVVYEPLDNPVDEHTLEGEIFCVDWGERKRIPFRMGSHYLLVDSDEVLWGKITDGVISFAWQRDPGDHYLVVSYDFARPAERKVAWLQEGF